MRYAADFRRAGRSRLAGKWSLSIGVSLVASLLGAGGSTSITFTLDDSAQIITSGGEVNLGVILRHFGLNISNSVQNSYYVSIMSTLLSLSLVFLLISGAVTLGRNLYFIGLAKGESPAFSALFSRFSVFFKSLGLMLYIGLLTFLWMLLFIIPGIVASYRYRLAPYLMAEYPDMSITDCVNESKRLMDGHKGRFFCLDLSFFGWRLLCVFTLGIGALWLNPYIRVTEACFYLERTGDRLTGDDIPVGPDHMEPEYVQNDGPERI